MSSAILTTVVMVIYAFIFALVIISLVRISRYFVTAGKEQKLIRMELGKLAEEVQQIRKQMGNRQSEDSA
jgi:hypothetical protein